MSNQIDAYIREVIETGDEGSRLLAAMCAPTLRNSEYVDILREGMNGLSVLRVPENYMVVVHSAAGDPRLRNPSEHAASLIENLFEQAKSIGASPLGLADVIDARTGERETVERIADAMVTKANGYKLAIMNGELAILGNRVNCDANISGTMIGMVPRDAYPNARIIVRNGIKFALFDPKGRAVYINSDGVGTKTEFHERSGLYYPAEYDSLAMKLDDTIKNAARAMVVYDVVERNGDIPIARLDEEAESISKRWGITYLLYHEDVGDRLSGWYDGMPTFNVSGSAVSVIDEGRLRNPPSPSAGEYLIAIRGRPNPRSNGITDKRKAMISMFGKNWHETPEGKMFLEFLAEPSTVLYPVFSELIGNGYASSVYHMSGGAYNGKLARPLARHGLFAMLDGIYTPDWRELAIGGFSFTPSETAYSKWPMGNDGFVSSSIPEGAIATIRKYGLEAKVVGKLELAPDGRTGVELAGIKASNGTDIYFSGK